MFLGRLSTVGLSRVITRESAAGLARGYSTRVSAQVTAGNLPARATLTSDQTLETRVQDLTRKVDKLSADVSSAKESINEHATGFQIVALVIMVTLGLTAVRQ